MIYLCRNNNKKIYPKILSTVYLAFNARIYSMSSSSGSSKEEESKTVQLCRRANMVLNGPRGKPHQPKRNDVMLAFLAEETMQGVQATAISFLLEVKRKKLFTVIIKKALRAGPVE